jgi:hypothetical protein
MASITGMKLIELFKQWRRKPFKTEITRAFTAGKINSEQMHYLCARIDEV